MRVRVRWMIRRDLAEVLAVEHAASDYPWSEADLLRRLRRRNVIGMVATARDQVVGLMVHAYAEPRIHLLNLAVRPDYSRRGVGRQMVDKLKERLTGRRTRVVARVRESATPAQLFLRVAGFRAVDVARGWFRDTGEDAYLMEYLAPATPAAQADESGWPARRLADGWPS
jgi:[ribosomal protein S18]-alanine N-acetyltransferase